MEKTPKNRASLDLSSLQDKSISCHIKEVCMPGKWVGEDAILCAADFLKRDIHVYIAAERFSPVIYSPRSTSTSSDAIYIAFYEPGHYRAVKHKPDGNCFLNHSSHINNLNVRHPPDS